jgi:predicted DNA-binding protein (UPF0251 family)
MRRRWCRRWSGPGRPMKPRFVRVIPETVQFGPIPPDSASLAGEPIYLSYDEFEAFRLIYYEGLNQEEAAKRMHISRGTVWRCLENARKKVASMLVERRTLVIASEPITPQTIRSGT